MRAIGWIGLVSLLVQAPAALGQTTPRPVRVGNLNVLVFGLGYPSFEHPNFKDELYPSLMYQHRILRREIRKVPFWLRGAVSFLSQDRKLYNTYTVWDPSDDVPFRETVTEHTSDFTVRLEALFDFLHTRNLAVYAGGGFGVHALTFNSDGAVSQISQFKATTNEASGSLAGGFRLFMAERSATLYGEVRYGQVYGRNSPGTSPPYLTSETFRFESVDAVWFEAGAGFHW